MTFGAFIDLYDDWNTDILVNDDNLSCILQDKVLAVTGHRPDLLSKPVEAFGIYDGILTVRLGDTV